MKQTLLLSTCIVLLGLFLAEAGPIARKTGGEPRPSLNPAPASAPVAATSAPSHPPTIGPGPSPSPEEDKPRIEVCFVLDTTGSMGGLIEGAVDDEGDARKHVAPIVTNYCMVSVSDASWYAKRSPNRDQWTSVTNAFS